jgi:hypothetical protein
MDRQQRETSIQCRTATRGRMIQSAIVLLLGLVAVATCDAFVVTIPVVSPVTHYQTSTLKSPCVLFAAVGIFFGTSVRILHFAVDFFRKPHANIKLMNCHSFERYANGNDYI